MELSRWFSLNGLHHWTSSSLTNVSLPQYHLFISLWELSLYPCWSFLPSAHYLLFLAFLMCQYFHPVYILLTFLLKLVFASYKAQLETPSLWFLHWVISQVSFFFSWPQHKHECKVHYCVFVECCFIEMLNIFVKPQWFFFLVLRKLNVSPIHFQSHVVLGSTTKLSRLWINVIDESTEMFRLSLNGLLLSLFPSWAVG